MHWEAVWNGLQQIFFNHIVWGVATILATIDIFIAQWRLNNDKRTDDDDRNM